MEELFEKVNFVSKHKKNYPACKELNKYVILLRNCSKTCLKLPLLRRPKICFQDQLSLNAGQKYCRMLPFQHSAILSTFIKLPFVIKIFVLSIFEWSFYTGFSVVEHTNSRVSGLVPFLLID